VVRTLDIQLLGDFRLAYGGKSITGIDTSRPQSVLAYLLLHRQAPQLRHHVAFALWPASTESQAHTNLRKQIHHLRRSLPDSERFLHVDGNTVQWRAGAPFTLDVAAFEREIAAAERTRESNSTSATQATLEKACELYRGELLPSCYDDWILATRERLFRMHLRALEQLARSLETRRDYATAICHVERLLEQDPMRETAYRRLMRLHALNGDRAKALQTYQRCAATVEHELGVEPSRATKSTYERLLVSKPVVALQGRHPAPLEAGMRMVGRQRPWTQLQAAWSAATRLGTHFALITGEVGVGKTRLAEELLGWAGRQGINTATTRSFSMAEPLAYAPIIGWLRTDALQGAISELDDVWATELARLLPELLTERPALSHPEPLTESWQRQRLFAAIARAVLAASQPLILFIDDLQWSDEPTLAWLHYLLRFQPRAQLLVVGTMRPEEVMDDHPSLSLLTELRGRGMLTEIDLGPLDRAKTAALGGQIINRELAADESATLYRETEGNPLFIVEALRTTGSDVLSAPPHLGARDAAQGPQTGIVPPSLSPRVRAAIERRLQHLSVKARELVDTAAMIGREFTFDVIARASDQEEGVLVSALDELWRRRIIRERAGDAYRFSHDKIREVTYAELSLTRRRRLQHRVARALQAVAIDHTAEGIGDPAPHDARTGEAKRASSCCIQSSREHTREWGNQRPETLQGTLRERLTR
jgi:DNA-binding SARP family transcriptional activator